MKVLVAGKGEVGAAIGELLETCYEVDYLDPGKQLFPAEFDYKVIHICFGFTEHNKFVDEIHYLYNLYHPNTIIINSTIPIDLNLDLPCFLYHWPVRGTHPNIIAGLLKYQNCIGPMNEKSKGLKWLPYFIKVQEVSGMKEEIKLLASHKETALGKLINTTWYAMQIAFCNNIKHLCNRMDIEFDQAYTLFMQTDEIGRSYALTDLEDNEGKRCMAKELIPRPVMRPGKMGGHCLLPNLKILTDYDEVYEMCAWIKNMDGIARWDL